MLFVPFVYWEGHHGVMERILLAPLNRDPFRFPEIRGQSTRRNTIGLCVLHFTGSFSCFVNIGGGII